MNVKLWSQLPVTPPKKRKLQSNRLTVLEIEPKTWTTTELHSTPHLFLILGTEPKATFLLSNMPSPFYLETRSHQVSQEGPEFAICLPQSFSWRDYRQAAQPLASSQKFKRGKAMCYCHLASNSLKLRILGNIWWLELTAENLYKGVLKGHVPSTTHPPPPPKSSCWAQWR